MVLSFLFVTSAFGAGGIVRNGEVLTIGSSGIRVELEPLPSEHLPELTSVAAAVRSLVLPTNEMGALLRELRPSPERKFFRVNRIHSASEEEMVKAYRNLMPDLPGSDNFTIFALTDPSKKETYLLPNFFRLATAAEKGAILFHESLVSGGARDTEKLVSAESAIQSFLKCATNCGAQKDELQLKILSFYSRSIVAQISLILLQKAAVEDGKNSALPGIITAQGDLNIKALLGSELFEKFKADIATYDSTAYTSFSGDYREARVADLAATFPNSRFMKILLNTGLNMQFTRLHRFSRNVPNLSKDGPQLPSSGISVISKWSYDNLAIRFSQSSVTYPQEILNYWKKVHKTKYEYDYQAPFTINSERDFFENQALLYAVQPIDLPGSTGTNRVFAKLISTEEHTPYGYGYGDDLFFLGGRRKNPAPPRPKKYYSGLYHHYVFGFLLN